MDRGGTRVTASAEAEKLLAMGEPLLAYNVLETALSDCPTNLRLRQLKGLSLARSGALERANVVLSELRHEGHNDGETLGLLARTHKDLGINSRDERRRRHHLLDDALQFGGGVRTRPRQLLAED